MVAVTHRDGITCPFWGEFACCSISSVSHGLVKIGQDQTRFDRLNLCRQTAAATPTLRLSMPFIIGMRVDMAQWLDVVGLIPVNSLPMTIPTRGGGSIRSNGTLSDSIEVPIRVIPKSSVSLFNVMSQSLERCQGTRSAWPIETRRLFRYNGSWHSGLRMTASTPNAAAFRNIIPMLSMLLIPSQTSSVASRFPVGMMSSRARSSTGARTPQASTPLCRSNPAIDWMVSSSATKRGVSGEFELEMISANRTACFLDARTERVRPFDSSMTPTTKTASPMKTPSRPPFPLRPRSFRAT